MLLKLRGTLSTSIIDIGLLLNDCSASYLSNHQGESFNVPENIEGIAAWRKHMEDCGFKRSRYGNIMTVSYTTGHIGMLMGEKDPRSASKDNEIRDRFDRMIRNGGRTSYYHPGLQRG